MFLLNNLKTTTNQWLDDHRDAVYLSDLGPCGVHVDFWPVEHRDAVYLSYLGPCGVHVDFWPVDHRDAVYLSYLEPCGVHVDFWSVDHGDAVYLSYLEPCGVHVDFWPGMTSSVTADTKQIRSPTNPRVGQGQRLHLRSCQFVDLGVSRQVLGHIFSS